MIRTGKGIRRIRAMRRRDRIIIEMNQKEIKLLRNAMLIYRNRISEKGMSTDDIDLIISKLYT